MSIGEEPLYIVFMGISRGPAEYPQPKSKEKNTKMFGWADKCARTVKYQQKNGNNYAL